MVCLKFQMITFTPNKPETEEVMTRTIGVQTNLEFDELESYSDDCFHDVRVMKRKLITDDIFKNDQTCRFYTGDLTILPSFITLLTLHNIKPTVEM